MELYVACLEESELAQLMIKCLLVDSLIANFTYVLTLYLKT